MEPSPNSAAAPPPSGTVQFSLPAESSMPSRPQPTQPPPPRPSSSSTPSVPQSSSIPLVDPQYTKSNVTAPKPALPAISFPTTVIRSNFVASGSSASYAGSSSHQLENSRRESSFPFSADVEAAASDRMPPSDGLPGSSVPPWRLGLLSSGLFLGLFLAMVDSSIVATSLLAIARDLGSDDLVNWVALAYTLAYLSCAAVFGRVADVVGRRNAFLAAFVIFFVFSVGCGFARNLHELIALRALQGVGGSGLYSLTMIIWPEVTPERHRKHIASAVGVVLAMSGVLGPLLGGLLTNYSSWRWIFWINGPIGFVAMLIIGFAWPKKEQLPAIELRSWKCLDFVGSILLMLSACLVTFSFQNIGSNPTKWTAPIFLGPLITGCLCGMMLLLWEWYIERRWERIMPALPLSLLRKHVFLMAILNTMCLGFPFFSVIFTIPLRLQVVNRATGLMAGVMLLPMLGGVAVGSASAGFITRRTTCLRDILVFASSMMVLGCGLESMLGDTPSFQRMALGFLPFIGLGLGMAATAATMIVTNESMPDGHAVAQGILAQARIFGGSMGIATSSVVLAQQEVYVVGRVIAYDFFSPKATGSPRTADLIRKAVAQAFQRDMHICTYVSGAAVLFAAMAFNLRNRQVPLLSNNAARQYQANVEVIRSTQSLQAEQAALLEHPRQDAGHGAAEAGPSEMRQIEHEGPLEKIEESVDERGDDELSQTNKSE